MPKQALGKGLGALIGRVDKTGAPAPVAGDPEPGEQVIEVRLADIVESKMQPRKRFTDEALEELAESIREHGTIQPLIVRRADGGKLELIAGERRFRANQRLGSETVPVIVRDKTDQEVLEMALIENLQREDLNPVEEAEAYVRLAKEFDLTQEQIAEKVGKNRATVANSMRLLDLAAEVQEHLVAGRITNGHAKAILGVKRKGEQKLLAEQVVKRGLTVRATEKLVSQHLNPEPAKSASSKKPVDSDLSAALKEVQDRLRERLATQVQIKHGTGKGKIEIEYYGNDDLDRLLELMGVA